MLIVDGNNEYHDSGFEYRDDEKREFSVVQRNDLIQNSVYKLEESRGKSLGVTEQKIISYVISKIKPDDDILKPQKFEITEFCNVCGIKIRGGYYYTALKKSIEELASKVMWLYNRENNSYTIVRWLDKATINAKSGTIELKLDDVLSPYLLNLHSNYTQFPLSSIIRMKSKYGIALYQLLKSYIYRETEIKFEIEYLKAELDCKNYKDNTNFKTRALVPALEDINKTELFVTMDFEKVGKQVTYVIFRMKDLSTSTDEDDRNEFYRRQDEIAKEIDPDIITMHDVKKENSEI